MFYSPPVKEAVHVHLLNHKRKLQSVLTASDLGHDHGNELTNSGSSALQSALRGARLGVDYVSAEVLRTLKYSDQFSLLSLKWFGRSSHSPQNLLKALIPAARAVCPCLLDDVDGTVDLTRYVRDVSDIVTSAKPGKAPGEYRGVATLSSFSLGGGVSFYYWTGKPPAPATAPGGGKKAARVPKYTEATAKLASAVAAFAPKEDQTARRTSFQVAAPMAPAKRDAGIITWAGDCGLVDISERLNLVQT